MRYAETDRMGLLHHANYLVYFELGRTELLRSLGYSYKDLEDQGYLLVITKVEVRYLRPIWYDDVVTLRTTAVRTTTARIEHRYEMFRDGELLTEGLTSSGLRESSKAGLKPLPDFLREERNQREAMKDEG